MELYNLISFLGIVVLCGIAWLFSSERKRMNWHVIIWGTILQLVFALFIFVVPAGTKLFLWINDLAVRIPEAASEGAKFVFGPLALAPGAKGSFGFILAFQAFPTIIFFSALVSVLYFYNILPAVIGVPVSDAPVISRIIGERMVLTEVASYQDLAKAIDNGIISNPRSIVITAYALCGFAHVASMAIVVGGVSALAPKRTQTLSKVAVRALVAATLACLMTACVAGAFYNKGAILTG